MSLDVRMAYAAAVAQVAKSLHSELPPWVFGWRLRDGDVLARNGDEWKAYYTFFHNPASMEAHSLQTDITSFFASINAERATRIVFDDAGSCAGAHLIEKIVQSHDRLASRSGLPQRSFASAIIANRYMAALDLSISQRLETGELSGAVRWMDDIYVTGPEPTLYKFFLDFQARVREMGLEANASKSKLGLLKSIRSDVLMEDMQEIPLPVKERLEFLEHGSDVTAEPVQEVDIEWLRKLEEGALNSPATQPPAVIKVILKTLRRHKEFRRFDLWLSHADRLSHLADTLSRYFRDAIREDRERLEEYCSWYQQYRHTEWASIKWSSAQFALAIPGTRGLSTYKAVMLDWLENSTDLHQISVAAQRLSSMDPTATKDIIRRRLDDEARPLFQRIYALALLNARDDRPLVRGIINSDPGNILTKLYLEDSSYAAPKVVNDYDWNPA